MKLSYIKLLSLLLISLIFSAQIANSVLLSAPADYYAEKNITESKLNKVSKDFSFNDFIILVGLDELFTVRLVPTFFSNFSPLFVFLDLIVVVSSERAPPVK